MNTTVTGWDAGGQAAPPAPVKTSPDRNDRRIVLGQPGYGEVTAGAARAFWHATRLPDRQVYRQYQEGSLLAANFNALWCAALNQAHHGHRVDYFAMVHSDVEPADHWLDALIDELEAKDLDVLGVVVPIKDEKGLTSIALDRGDGDTFRPLCRLTMSEVFRLPETFTSADVGHPLLLNTGLWVCRFDEAWARKVRFTINDRIVFDKGSDRYLAQCEPEDWYFSRLCHELGLKVGCTRKVPLSHRGGASFTNTRPWGEPFDSAWTDRSVVPDDLPGWVFPRDIDGWIRPAEGRELARLAAGKRVLEVGGYLGLSTVCMAQTAKFVVSVDPHDGRTTPMPQGTLAGFKANLDRYNVRRKVHVVVGTTADMAFDDAGARFDLIFIDGDHSREAVEHDIARARELLAPGGLIAFHDYGTAFDSNHPGVTQAVDALVSAGGELLSLTDSLAVVRPPALIPLEV